MTSQKNETVSREAVLLKPAIWLLILIVGLPQLSETVYTPSLPDIAHSLHTSDAMVEYTLSIYLFAFAIGTLLWGRISDRIGRKAPLILGLCIYVAGCIGCAAAPSIEFLLLSRFIQAFGGSTGSILGQIICRDAFHGKERGIIFSSIGSALSIAPAIGPFIGGSLDQFIGWRGVFVFLIFFGALVCLQSKFFLPETHPKHQRTQQKAWLTAKKLFQDPKVLTFGAIVGGLNGIVFSYYAEGSFYLIDILGISPFSYGLSFILLAFCGAAGSKISGALLKRHYTANTLIISGLSSCLVGLALFTMGSFIGIIHESQQSLSVGITLMCMAIVYIGIGLSIPSLLSHALSDYQSVVGTASSLFGFYYYLIVAGMTFIMAFLRNGALTMMPLYFLVASCIMLILFKGYTLFFQK